MAWHLVATTDTLLREIRSKRMKRDDVAQTYALAIRSSFPTDWEAVNRAIVKRWSESALVYIKARAWRIVKKE